MKYLYHGSAVPRIEALKARSILHGTDQRIVYLTDNIPYALFYIWDEGVTGYGGKHVAGAVKNGVAYCEEQFPGQLEQFYKGASGCLYYAPRTAEMGAVENRESMFYNRGDTPVQARHISDVYQDLLKYEGSGALKVLRFEERTPERQNRLVELMAQAIAQEDFCQGDKARQAFMKRYFSLAWQRARETVPPRSPVRTTDCRKKHRPLQGGDAF